MLNDYINRLAKLSNSSILTPYNLLENLQLDNYLSVNYYKKNEYIVADIIFIEHNEEIKFRYFFDNNEYLQKIYYVNGDESILYFDRAKEKKELITELNNNYTFEIWIWVRIS